MTAPATAFSVENPRPLPRPIPRQPWLHELRVSVNGNVTALSTPSGDMGALVDGSWSSSGAEGVYVDDRRSVSVLW